MEQFKEWWESITPREQYLAMSSAIVILIAVLYWAIWTPLTDQLDDSKKQLTRAQATLTWTQEKANVLLQSGVQASRPNTGNLQQIINSSGRRNNITFERIVNKNETLEVSIKEVEFDAFVEWLAVLSNQYGVSVLSTDLTKLDQPGFIKVSRLVLGR